MEKHMILTISDLLMVNDLQDKPEGLEVSSIRLIDCSLPRLRGLGNVAVADVDGGIHICMHAIATMPQTYLFPFLEALSIVLHTEHFWLV